ncbi:MAG: tRNA-(ms[2]io[6]A)-hydroxylase [Gammaproteobacteria bacterium]|nr:tRNA-(ms[2]io[6]A)-hydroxylase [Gammaproteobacteria bacterium]
MPKHYANPTEFLAGPTPTAWVEAAAADLPLILVDHAHCEKKAASTAINLLFRYPEFEALTYRMSRLAREELRHFEQVLKLMKQRDIAFGHLGASRYAEGLRAKVRSREPERLVDILVVGAFIEARSCERFEALAPALQDREVAEFYLGLCASESRHFQQYLSLAGQASDEDIQPRIEFFAALEMELNTRPDSELRFHSGPPQVGAELKAAGC